MKKIFYVLLIFGAIVGVKKVSALNFGVGTTGPGVGTTGPSTGGLICTDTDAKDIYSRGSVTYTYINSSGVKVTNTKYDECNGSGTQINEKWCYEIKKRDGSIDVVDGNIVSGCSFGCVNGACKKSASENPTPLPTPTATPGKLTCTDTDGNSINTKGSVTYTYLDENKVKRSKTIYDECNGSGTQVSEMWCYKTTDGSEDFVPGRMVSNCTYGCINGACRKTAEIVKKVTPIPTKKPTLAPTKKTVGIAKKLTCSDSDLSKRNYAIYEKGSVTFLDKDGVTNVINDECNGSGTQVNEMYCYEAPIKSKNFLPGKKVYNCSKGCKNGACVVPPSFLDSIKRMFGLR